MFRLRDVLEDAQKRQVAVGHFNVGDLATLKAIFASARELNVPVIVGVSEGERQFIGDGSIAAIVRSLREESGVRLFLNADHVHSLKSAIDAVKAGFDALVFDLSGLPIGENIQRTKDAVKELKALNPAIMVEGEIGDIGTGSEIHETAPDLTKGLTRPEEAKRFVDATGIDMLAPSVGNMHGLLPSMVRGQVKKQLDVDRIARIKRKTAALLTLHGGSGTDDDSLRQAVSAGINIVHINTELRVAWRRGLEAGLSNKLDEVVPYKILPFAVDAIKEVVMARLKLLNNLH
ncbi:class II fructose-bisphosphate aldolase [Bradyrhizobium sp. LHD-71]|uniref:class II fructose-bisphosphate aldolase n=1 Tax=Bradyrhizobium sp. LHD-71 TaxID=3072141 RepID=UPI00280D52E1|nr:class II fructose-bisphosphate aldolase [Bradyrhizobium sp. LHD-71]MDQ8727559.1 class II fructose-bisphosphate aldolase [Bradyrhizobium sp. LHD-71]